MSNYTATIMVTEYPPHMKHRVIFETFGGLKSGDTMLLVNDHDPVPLRFQFESMHPGKFTWSYVEQGPDTFRVEIGKK